MARRRFLSAVELARELDTTPEQVLEAVRAGELLILAPPRKVLDRIPPAGERGGGYSLTGTLAWARAGLVEWLVAYLSDPACAPVDDPVRAANHGRAYDDGLRLYVRPDAVARGVAARFTPPPRPDQVRARLEEAGATRGRPLGVDPDTEGGRLLWWRVPSHIHRTIHKELRA